jgi:hypothetical protein
MDLRTYFQLFWVPAIASAALMTLLWAQDELSGRTPLFLAGWFLLALGAQYLGTMTSVLWVVGLGLQTVLATFLLLKHRLGQFLKLRESVTRFITVSPGDPRAGL